MERCYEKLSPDEASMQVFLIEYGRCTRSANSAQGHVVPNYVLKYAITITGKAYG